MGVRKLEEDMMIVGKSQHKIELTNKLELGSCVSLVLVMSDWV